MKKKIQKPFNVEAAKGGAKVETRDGDAVRILCYDRKNNNCINFPIIALINHNGEESCFSYTSEGRLLGDDFNIYEDAHDLVIIEEVEVPKFSVGNWMVPYNEYIPRLITAVTNDCYELEDVNGHKISICHRTIENLCRLWTLKDAKPGDVLTIIEDKRSFIFKGCLDKDHPNYPTAFCGIDRLNNFAISKGNYWWTNYDVRPANTTEKELFYNKVKEAGYEWNSDTLILSKIEKYRNNQNANINGYFIDNDSKIINHSGWNIDINYNVFATEKQAKSALAMARISQIMANDKRFGGIVTDEEWTDKSWYSIIRINNDLRTATRFCYELLAFHTKKQADLFLEENEDLVKDYYMID